jgi:hypothetical protein
MYLSISDDLVLSSPTSYLFCGKKFRNFEWLSVLKVLLVETNIGLMKHINPLRRSLLIV